MLMHNLEVSIINGEIALSQHDDEGVTQVINLTPEQADFACEWIAEAAENINKDIAKK